MRQFSLFNHSEISNGMYLVTENYSMEKRFSIGVVVGTEKILVIDAGFGMAGSLRRYIESFAGEDKEMLCICTHGHSDTLGAVGEFDRVYLKKEDVGVFGESYDPALRLEQLAAFTSDDNELVGYGKENMIDNRNAVFLDVRDGERFDIGNSEAVIYALPGHTPGSIAIRVQSADERYVTFAGDAFSPGMNHLLKMDQRALLEYSNVVKNFSEKLEEKEAVYCVHSQLPMNRKAGLAVARACREAAEGNTGHDPVFKNNPDCRIHFCDNYGIVYNYKLLSGTSDSAWKKQEV